MLVKYWTGFISVVGFQHMNAATENFLAEAKQLPDSELISVAAKIEDLVIDRKLAASELSFEQNGGIPFKEAFDQLEARYGG